MANRALGASAWRSDRCVRIAKESQTGSDAADGLDYIPGRFVPNRIARPRQTRACSEPNLQAPQPHHIVERRRPGGDPAD